MRRLLLAAVALLAGSVVVSAFTTSTRLGLSIPQRGDTEWASAIIAWLQRLDTYGVFTDYAQTFTAAQTFSGSNSFTAPNTFSASNSFTAQQRISGASSGLDVEGPAGSTGSTGSIGIGVEDDVTAFPIVNGSSSTTSGFGPAYLWADAKGQATGVLESHNTLATQDSVVALRRSRGTGHAAESAVLKNDYLGTLMYQGWVTGGLNASCTASTVPFSCCTGSGTGTCTGSWNGAYGQAMGLECYADEDWTSTALGTRCSFYSTASKGAAAVMNAACTGLTLPYTCCTGSGRGNCAYVPTEVWGTSAGTSANAICTSSGTPYACCTGSGTGSCTSNYPQFFVKGQRVYGSTVFQNAALVPNAINEISYEDNTSVQKFDYVTESTQGAGDHARVLRAVPQRVSVSNTASATVAMTIPLAGGGPVMSGACTTPGCQAVVMVVATAECTTKGTSAYCGNTGEGIAASRTIYCNNRSGTLTCNSHVVSGDPSSWYADTLTGGSAPIAAQPITFATSSSNLQIKVANPDANSSVLAWVVTAEIVSSGL